MKLRSSLLLTATATLLTVPSVVAKWENLTLSDYKLKESGYSDLIAKLDDELNNASVAEVIADTNHKNPNSKPSVKGRVDAYTWEDKPGYDDANTEKWYPQGITTSYDAYAKGTYGENEIHLVSWHSSHYDDGKRGARISFVDANDPDNRSYRNVLLVEPTEDKDGKPNFKAIDNLHAGGIAWYGNLLYVVSTGMGLRVFDLAHIYQVSSGDGIGRVGDEFRAYNYKYVLPQVRTYAWQSQDGVEDFRFSFIALDRTSTPDSIITGEYNKDAPNRLIHFDINYKNRRLFTKDGIATASRGVSHGNTKIQGAITVNNKYYLTQSSGDLIEYSWLDGKKTHSSVFNSVAEDLSYQKGLGLWSLMEAPGHRHVAAVDPAKL